MKAWIGLTVVALTVVACGEPTVAPTATEIATTPEPSSTATATAISNPTPSPPRMIPTPTVTTSEGVSVSELCTRLSTVVLQAPYEAFGQPEEWERFIGFRNRFSSPPMYLPVDAFWSELGPLALTFFQEGYGGLGLELLGMAREREFRISDQILFGLTVDCDSEVESVFRSFDLSGGITDIPPVTDAIRVRAAFILLALSILIVPEPDDFTSPLNEACTRLYYAFGTMPPGIFPEPDVRASYENARSSSTSDDPSLTLSEDQFWRQIEFAYTALYDGDVQGEFLAAIANLRDAREMEENTYVALGRLFVRNCL